MYANHVPTIAAAMRANADTFARGVLFVILSIRQQTPNLPDQMADVAREGELSPYLFGFKRDSFRYLQAHKRQLWQDVCATTDTAEALTLLTRVPGLGLVKAAFVAQLMGFDVACLDTRNLIREGFDLDRWALHGRKTGKAFTDKLAEYLIYTAGRARDLWDTWCVEVADAYGRTAEAISQLHLDCIVPMAARTDIVPVCVPLYGTPDAIPF